MSDLFPDYRASWETDQHRELRRHAAEFFRREATPNQERWARNHQVDREFWNKLGDAGLLGLDLPEVWRCRRGLRILSGRRRGTGSRSRFGLGLGGAFPDRRALHRRLRQCRAEAALDAEDHQR